MTPHINSESQISKTPTNFVLRYKYSRHPINAIWKTKVTDVSREFSVKSIKIDPSNYIID